MYVPKAFEELDRDVMHALIRTYPLGAWVVADGGSLVVNHIPFHLDPSRGTHGTLVGHVSRQNAVWKSLGEEVPSVVIFQGAQGYVTPSWYPSKQEHGKVVPTWNYAVVHAHGVPCAIEDREWLHAHVTRLVDAHESPRDLPWHVSDAPDDYIGAMLKAIVGIEMPIDTLAGKWKMSQNRAQADREGVRSGLTALGHDGALRLAADVGRLLEPRARDDERHER